MVVVNTIVEGTINGRGIFFAYSQNASVSYCDFHNNSGGDVYGSMPSGLGAIVSVNANGDSCDTYNNIFLDPLFYSLGGDSAYHLTEDSPCIDAGDPSSPFDPDGTVADIGAFYFNQGAAGPLTVTLTPYNPPIQIPANGGSFRFNIAVSNTGTNPETFDIWTMATLPNGNEYGPIINIPGFTAPANWSGNRDRTQAVPGSAPAGMYTYDAYVGVYPDDVWDEDHFEFEKLAVSDGGSIVSDWNNWGEHFLVDNRIADICNDIHPSEFILHPSIPNPFNPETRISFSLPEASEVSLVVYDVQGREVATLINGWRPAGMHEVTFNASDLTSGVYFARLTAGDFTQTQKLLLIK